MFSSWLKLISFWFQNRIEGLGKKNERCPFICLFLFLTLSLICADCMVNIAMGRYSSQTYHFVKVLGTNPTQIICIADFLDMYHIFCILFRWNNLYYKEGGIFLRRLWMITFTQCQVLRPNSKVVRCSHCINSVK